MSTETKNTTSSVGAERFKADVRMFGGLLLVVGAAATFSPLANVAAGITPGSLPTGGLPLWGLISGLIVATIGSFGMLVGYLTLVHDYATRPLVGSLIALTQLAWIPFLTELSGLGMAATEDPSMNQFIPPQYNPSAADVSFVGAMGLMAAFAYGLGLLGTLGFAEFSLFSYVSGKPGDRSAGYYRGRMTLYMFMLGLAGLTQLLLGLYTLSDIGSGPLDAPVSAAMYVVYFPELSIFVGLVQLLMGIWGMARRFGVMTGGANDHSFQIGMAVTWIFVLSMTVMTQIAYAPGDELAAAAPSTATLVLGLHILPTFLDYKARTTPEELPHDYYDFGEEPEENKVAAAAESMLEETSDDQV